MLLSLQNITINNYKNYKPPIISSPKTFHNIIFLKQRSTKELIQIINNKKNYTHIKKLLFDILPIDKNYNDAFIELEKNGFNTFKPLHLQPITIQNIIATKYNFLFKDKIPFPYFKICTKNMTPLFSKSNMTLLNENTLTFLQLLNDDLFVPYSIFNNDNMESVMIYQTNTYIKNILIIANGKSLLNPLLKLSNTLITSLGEFLGLKYDGINIDLILYLSNCQKVCPNNDQIISKVHVNSGSTTTYNDNYADPLIKIYRLEELGKVLLHELIHAFKYDKIFDDYPKHSFKVSRDKLLFTESVTECLARVINIILYSHIYNEDLRDMMQHEITFGLIQTAKIFNMYGFVSVEDFLKRGDDREIKQETSAFEYYILTTILLMNIDRFLEIIKRKGNIMEVVKMIDTTFKDNVYCEKVNGMIMDIKHGDINKKLIDTCRMTILKINFDDI
jgi:hypothetical protein